MTVESCNLCEARQRELEALKRLNEVLAKRLDAIATAQQRWTENVGSYAGGETNAGFAARLQRIARGVE